MNNIHILLFACEIVAQVVFVISLCTPLSYTNLNERKEENIYFYIEKNVAAANR